MSKTVITSAMCGQGRSIGAPKLSPTGDKVCFVSVTQNRTQLVLVDSQGGPEVVIATDPAMVTPHLLSGGVYEWHPNGQDIVYVAKDGIYSVSIFGGSSELILAGDNLSSPVLSDDASFICAVVDDKDILVLDLVDSNQTKAKRIQTGADFVLDPSWNAQGVLSWIQWNVPDMAWDNSWITFFCFWNGKVKQVAGGPKYSVSQPHFSPDGSRLAYLSDKLGWNNLWIYDLNTNSKYPLVQEHFEHGDPTWGPGQRSFVWSEDGKQIAFIKNQSGNSSLWIVELETQKQHHIHNGVDGALSWKGGRLCCISSNYDNPTRITTFSPFEDSLPTHLAQGPVGGFELTPSFEPKGLKFNAVDETGDRDLYGRFYRSSVQKEQKGLLVWIHGGPTGQTKTSFNSRFCYFLDKGWSILVPDYRGSSGWGKKYLQSLNHQWGIFDTADVARSIEFIQQQNIFKKVVLVGASAGGFTALNLMSNFPQLCDGGIVLYPLSDLVDATNSIHRLEAHYFHSLIGPIEDKKQDYQKRSPIYNVDKIQAPLLVFHGDQDKVIPIEQSVKLVSLLKEQNKKVDFVIYKDQGHGWKNPAIVQDELEKMTIFLDSLN